MVRSKSTWTRQGRWVWVIIFLIGCGHVGHAIFPERPAQVLLEKPVWPHVDSDLAPDPALVLGRLENGFRYVMMENKTPRNRVSMHLYVQSGSLAEGDGEEGIAHFLEHMLFDGSTHFPPGELVKYFQRIGMQFGPDANAHTGFGQTVYDILLPEGDPQSIADGLLVLGDFAAGALILPDEVEKEKQVVLAEKRARDSAQYRTMQAAFKFEMPGSLLPQRFPIGTEESIGGFDAAMVRGFYDAWYRPERMILVMVGDFDPSAATPLIEKQFGGLEPRGQKRDLPPFGHFSHEGLKTFYHPEKEMGATTVRIERVVQETPEADSVLWQQGKVFETLANRMMQWRLDDLVHRSNGIMTDAAIRSGEYLQQIGYGEISADCKPEHWEQVLALMEQSLRQALVFGFTPSELERAKKALRTDLQQDVDEMATRESRTIAAHIMDSFNQWRVYQSPLQRQQLLEPMIDQANLPAVNSVFRTQWREDHRLVLVTGNADAAAQGEEPEDHIRSVYLSSAAHPVEPLREKRASSFPYLTPPSSAGFIKEHERVADLGIESVVFDNGVTLILKQTDFKQNEIEAALSFGGGKSSEPSDQPGLAELTEKVVNESGFGRISRIDLEQALAGRRASASLDVREDMFVLAGHASSSELTLLIQVLYTMVEDPGYRPDAFTLARKQLEKRYGQMIHSAEGLLQIEGLRFLAGGDGRLGSPAWREISERTLSQIEHWYGTQLARAPLEISLVGDFAVDEAIRLVSTYFGSLPARSEPMAAAPRPRPAFPRGESLLLQVDTAIDRGLVVVAYPTDDFWDIGRTRRLSILSEVFSERLREQVRENLGASYSPYSYHRAYRAYEGYGMLLSMLLVDPSIIDAVISEVITIGAQLSSKGIDADELRRALDPTLVQIKDMRRTNRYWLNSVLLGSSRHPEQLAWARSIESDYASIEADDISAMARRYLDNTRVARVVIVPGANP